MTDNGNGTGHGATVTDRCPGCGGYGLVHGAYGDPTECIRCGGSGTQYPPRCTRCGGFGKLGEGCKRCAVRHPADNRWSIIVEVQATDVVRAREIIQAALAYRMGVRARTKTVQTEYLDKLLKPLPPFQEARPPSSGAVRKGKEITGRGA